MPRKPRRKKFPKLTKREKELASRFIAEEHRTGKFKPRAAVAVGLSRARRAAAKEKIDAIVDKYA